MCTFPHSYVATLGTHWKWIFLIVSLLFGFTESHLASVMSGKISFSEFSHFRLTFSMGLHHHLPCDGKERPTVP